MTSSVVITTVGAAFTAIATIIVGWLVRRSDRSAKLAQQYFDDAAFNMSLVGALRSDYWGLADWAGMTRHKWHRLMMGLPLICNGQREALASLLQEIGDLPELPEPRHRQLEQQRRRSDPKDEG